MAQTNFVHSVRKPKQKQVHLRVIYGTEGKLRLKLGLMFYFSCAVFVGLIIFSLFYRIQLTELTEKISTNTKKLEILESEELYIKAKLEDKLSSKNIEKEALNLGMEKIRNYQIEYINISNGSNTEISR